MDREPDQIRATNFKGEQLGGITFYADVPDECPICHANVDPKRIKGIIRGQQGQEGSRLQVVFQCTKNSCESLFIGTYIFGKGSRNVYQFKEIAPKTAKEEKFSEEIEDISSTFIEVYNQALAAEAANLTQLTGIGLRKALEFLIKDFLVRQKPTEKVKMEKSSLSVCIKTYIDDNRLKDCAERAVWLGNDETHYMRTWQDKDIRDLKLLMKLTVSWMETILLTEKYKQSMQNS